MNRTVRRFLPALVIAVSFFVATIAPAAAESKADLSRLVVVGDSLSAGFQNGSLLASQQVNGYANLIAHQARVPLDLPLIEYPGIPNVLQLKSVKPLVIAPSPGQSTGRLDPTAQAIDLAVPGHTVQDALTTRPTFTFNNLTDFVLGLPGFFALESKSQVEWAQALDPTTVILWIGNNDALGAATNGNDHVTPVKQFAASYAKVIDALAATDATLVVANIPDVTAIPFLFPVDKVAAEFGVPPSLLASAFGLQPGDYVTLDYLPTLAVRLQTHDFGPLPDNAVLTAAEAANVSAAVNDYNAIIEREAERVGAALVDIHALFVHVKERGYVVNGRRLTADFLGGIFSLDGIHPTNTGYAVVANEFIRTMNREVFARIPSVSVEQVAKKDPLILTAVGRPAAITKGSMEQMRKMLGH